MSSIIEYNEVEQLDQLEQVNQVNKINEVVDTLKGFYPDKITHMRELVKIYKYIFKLNIYKPIYKKDDNDVIQDVADTPLSLNLDNNIENELENMMKYESEEKEFPNKISSVSLFIDTAFLYYIWLFDDKAPICKLPFNVIKYELITSVLGIPKDELYYDFEKCVKNSLICEMRNNNPPYLNRTDLPIEEVKDNLEKIVKPIYYSIMQKLIKIHFNFLNSKNLNTNLNTNTVEE
jgi:hypothetical protein